MVVAYKYKEACSCIGSATHAPKQFDLVKGKTKIALKTCDWKIGMAILNYLSYQVTQTSCVCLMLQV